MNYLNSVQEAIDLIEDNIRDDIELDKIAKTAAMSLPHLYRLFYSLTGHPIKEYLRKRRISIASEHLKNSNKPFIDIALECGFESQASFSKSFKKIVGVTPKIYKESDLVYCFERINLIEKVNYLEGRDLFERYPDVKVIQLKEMDVLSYIHESDNSENLEMDAFKVAQKIVLNTQLIDKGIRYFGRNIEIEGSEKSRYAYEVLVPVEKGLNHPIQGMDYKTISGGMYAVGSTSSDSDQKIFSLWNRMYSEWLPKSLFKEGSHTYLEEYITYNSKLVRMKLYLPIERQLELEMIKVEQIDPFWVAFCKVYGKDAQEKADATLSEWLNTDPSISVSKSNLYFSYNYGYESDAEHWDEFGITTFIKQENIDNPNINQKILGGGLFVTIETKPYGAIIGVLEIIHRWIVSKEKYILDDTRQWFALYQHSSSSLSDKDVTVLCCIPILERSKLWE